MDRLRIGASAKECMNVKSSVTTVRKEAFIHDTAAGGSGYQQVKIGRQQK